MKRLTMLNVLWVVAAGALMTGSAMAGQLQAWGWDSDAQISNLPAGNLYVAIAAGDAHGLALRSDGTIVAWGQNVDGESIMPSGTFRAVAAGADFSLAIRTDGSIAAWGSDSDGQVSRRPLSKDFVAVDGGETFAVALRSDGSIVAWGNDNWGQVTGAPKGTGFKAVMAGDAHGVALRANGSLVTWGYPAAIRNTPTTGAFTAIGAGGSFCVAVRSDGSLVWWGTQNPDYGISHVPAGNDYVAVSAGYEHCLALKKDGSVVGWGAGTETSLSPHWGQANPPMGKNYTAIAAGLYYSLALTGDSSTPGITDSFDDNQRGSLWTLRESNPDDCWLDEVHNHLELRATTNTHVSTAYYVSNNWRLDPSKDFSFKIRFHYELYTESLGWLAVGLTPDIGNLNPQHVEFGPGCGEYFRHIWYEAIDGNRAPDTAFAERTDDDGALYVSYEAAVDKLYVSTTGYGARNALGTIAGLLQKSWEGKPLWLYLGGGSDGQEIGAGEAYFDGFVMDTGGSATTTLSGVHRFWSPILQTHFYTIDEVEKDRVIKNWPQAWIYEGVAFQAAPTANATGLAPVYRFWSLLGQGHFYTIDQNEKDRLVKNSPQAWLFEGVAFYAYPEGAQPSTSKPVYRFWRPNGDHFYTIDPEERDRVLKTYSKIYNFEGTAFYAFP